MIDSLAYESRQRRRRKWLVAGVLVLGGCASTCDGQAPPSTIGELGNGRFSYICGGVSDPVCEFDNSSDFPDCIALGGSFALEYMLLDTAVLGTDSSPVLYIESVNQSFFRGDDNFEALRTGEAAFVVREDEQVVDLLHMTIVEPDSMDIFARDPATPTDSVQLAVGETEEFRVFPRSFGCASLGGAVPIVAESSDEAIATISEGDILRIQGQGIGTAVVRVRLGELEEAITVEVSAGNDPVRSSGPDVGTTSDTSTDGTSTGGTDGSGSSGGSSITGGST